MQCGITFPRRKTRFGWSIGPPSVEQGGQRSQEQAKRRPAGWGRWTPRMPRVRFRHRVPLGGAAAAYITEQWTPT